MTEANSITITHGYADELQSSLLIGLCDSATQLEARAMALFDAADDLLSSSPDKAFASFAGERLRSQVEVMAGVVADMPSSDIAGLLAKARLVIALSGEADDEHGRLASSVARDICCLLR